MKRLLLCIAVLFTIHRSPFTSSARAASPFPMTYNLICYAGSDCTVMFHFKDVAGNSVDLTGNSYSGQVMATYLATANLIVPAVSLDAKNGLVTVTLTAAQTAALKGKTGVWRLQQTDQNGLVTFMEQGSFKCAY
jgi:hypothetical protein